MPRLLIALTICLPLLCEVLVAQSDSEARGETTDDSAVEFNLEESAGSKLVNWTAKIGYSSGPITRYGDFLILGGTFERDNTSGRSVASMICLDAHTGELIDHLIHPRLSHRANDMPGQAIKSKLSTDGDIGYYVSNRGELVAMDLSQLGHGGSLSKQWVFDMVTELGVFKRDAGDIGNPTCSPLPHGELVFCLTGHGTTFGYRDSFPRNFPPNAPSFIALDKQSGQLKWKLDVPGDELLLGQWASPAVISPAGVDQVVFPGGNGVLYGVDPKTGKVHWSLPCNPPSRTDWSPIKRGTKCFFVAKPTVQEETLFVSLCQDHESREVPGVILAIDLKPIAEGASPKIHWTYENPQFGQTSGELSYHDGRLFGVSRSGMLVVLDAESGKELSLQSIGSRTSLLGSLQISNGQLFVCSDHELIRYSLDVNPRPLTKYRFPKTVENSPLVDGNQAFVTTRGKLWSINLQ